MKFSDKIVLNADSGAFVQGSEAPAPVKRKPHGAIGIEKVGQYHRLTVYRYVASKKDVDACCVLMTEDEFDQFLNALTLSVLNDGGDRVVILYA